MKVSVIIPCYNEEEVLPLSHKRFSQVMGSTAHDYELIFVNDGSKDHTEELLLGFANDDPHTKVISFSRNFGHQNAVSAGLHNCTGDIAVIIDVDLQDPPEVIPQMIDTYLKEGSNVVYAVRNKREGETFMKKFTHLSLIYRLVTINEIPETISRMTISRLIIPPSQPRQMFSAGSGFPPAESLHL
mgnify:CR=1 FL=1